MSQIVYLKTACERCSGRIEYPSELAGQSIECPYCHQTTPLPPPSFTSPTPPLLLPQQADSERKTELVGHKEKQKAGITPEAYMAAVKSYPRVVVRGRGEFLYHGYAIRREGERVVVIPDFIGQGSLGKDNLRTFAERSTPDHLYASPACSLHVGGFLYGELPSKEQLRDYFVSRHGKLEG